MPRLAATAAQLLSPKFSLYRNKMHMERLRNVSLFRLSFLCR